MPEKYISLTGYINNYLRACPWREREKKKIREQRGEGHKNYKYCNEN